MPATAQALSTWAANDLALRTGHMPALHEHDAPQCTLSQVPRSHLIGNRNFCTLVGRKEDLLIPGSQ